MDHQHHNFFFLLLLLFRCCSAAFTPADNYLLDCGSTTTTTFSDGSDPRSFLPDSTSTSYSNRITFSFDGSSTLTNPSNSTPNLYRTARFFPSFSSYNFQIKEKGIHVVRLHFYPFSTTNHNLSTSVFNVSASGFPLLTSFSPNSSSSSDPLIPREFFLPINVTTFSISFSSSAFINAIEVFSAPSELFDNTPKEIISATRTVDYKGLSSQVLETVHRINVGGKKVTPNNDTLWRTWVPDDDFLETKSLSQAKSGTVKYQSGIGLGVTEEIAPRSVYDTVREMNRNGANNSDGRFNLTWALNVSSGKQYLVRMHFCDIVSDAVHDLVFNSYVNGFSAFQNIDIATQRNEVLAAPYYTDSIVDAGSAVLLRVGVGPSTRDSSKVNAILNGLEIMKMNGVAVLSESQGESQNLALIVGVVVGSLVLVGVVIVLVMVVLRRRRRRRKKPTSIPPEGSVWTPLHPYSLSTGRTMDSPLPNLNLELKMPFANILLATKNFDKNYQIGQGGFGKVYKGVLQDGMRIAVKRGSQGSGQGLSEFYTEILVLSKIRHRHLVSLIGYCEEQSEMILVYEFMEKGTLRDHLYGSDRATWPSLSWKQRLEICIGSTRGLHYLHTGSDAQGIIHRDVKSANILLDENYVAKVADFGLSKSGPLLNETNVSTNVKGSFGYLDPEYFKTQQLTDKSDVYSFGVVLLEVLCARRAIDRSLPWEQQNLAEWGLKCIKKGELDKIVDTSLRGSINPNSLRKFGETIEKCLAQYGVDRPPMADVLWNLEYALKLQETDRSSEPYDDSVTSVSTAISNSVSTGRPVIPMPNVLPVPLAGISNDSQVTSSQVFSQLISSEGR